MSTKMSRVDISETEQKDVIEQEEKRLRKLTEKGAAMYEDQVHKYTQTLRKVKKDLEYLFTVCDEPEQLLFPQTLQNKIKTAYEEYEKVSNTFVEILKRYRTRESENEVHTQLFLLEGLRVGVGTVLDRIDTVIKQQQLDAPVSRHSGSTSSRSKVSSVSSKQRVKLEIQTRQIQYDSVKKESDIVKRRAELEAETMLLKQETELAIKKAELKMMEEAEDRLESSREGSGASADNLYTKKRVENYVNDQMQYKISDLNPSATPFVPMEVGPISTYMMRMELALSKLEKFDDTSDMYPTWKVTFRSVVDEVSITASEELRLLIRWLGPESANHARSMFLANSHNPAAGLEKVWSRMDERYGSAEVIEARIKERIKNFPSITPKTYNKLYNLSDLLSELKSLKTNPKYETLLSYYDSSSGINPIVEKLPYHLRNKWMEKARRNKKENNVLYPRFGVFVGFIGEMASLYNDPAFKFVSENTTYNAPNKEHLNVSRKRFVSTKKTDIEMRGARRDHAGVAPVSSVRSASVVASQAECVLHEKAGHTLAQCREFKTLPLEERRKFLKQGNICYKCCDSTEHVFRDCPIDIKCTECNSNRHCTAMHLSRLPSNNKHSGLIATQNHASQPSKVHGGEGVPNPNQDVVTKCTEICGDNFVGRSCAKITLVDISHDSNPNISVRAYAIHDDQSNRTLVKPELLDLLGVQGDTIPYKLISCGGSTNKYGRQVTNLTIKHIDGSASIHIPVALGCDGIPNDRSEIPTPEIITHYPHLKKAILPPMDEKSDILILIGRDVTEAHLPRRTISDKKNPTLPFAQKLPLGWVVVGEMCLNRVHKPNVVNVNKINTSLLEGGRGSIFQPCNNNFVIKECLDPYKGGDHSRLGSSVFNETENDNKVGLSIDDKEFINIMENGLHKNSDGNWVAPLPFRTPRCRIPNNRLQAFNRAQMLDRNLQKNPVKKEHFVTFMQKIFDTGSAEIAPKLDNDKEAWYLPLFGVYHPNKRDKIRGVYDSSAVHQGVSLNGMMLSGPDMLNSLLGILLRFRKDEYAVIGDIEQMFYSFFVEEKDRDFLRFFWYRDNKPENELIEYRMCVHVFGNSPSPAVAIHCLNKTVENSDQDVKEFVQRNFYVDDGLTSLPSSEQAVDLMKRTQNVLKSEGNIKLHKICSNSVDVLKEFPPEELGKGINICDFGSDKLPVQHSLGLIWDVNLDMFTYRVSQDTKPYTRRGILSVINSLFDPIGFISPVVGYGKDILRQITPKGTNWDEPLSQDYKSKWDDWKSSLQDLESLLIPRMYARKSLSLIEKREVHIYSDASEKAISAVAYVKTIGEDGQIQVGFLMGKTKLSPQHAQTIPRLELCAAVLASEIGEFVANNLDFPLKDIVYHTDSCVVLGYICNTTRRFYTYVCNRIERIRRASNPSQWMYVPSGENPADQGTRFLKTSEIANSIWLNGPIHMYEMSDIEEKLQGHPMVNANEDPEIRVDVKVAKTTVTSKLINKFEKFSSFYRLINAIHLLKRHIRQYKYRKLKLNNSLVELKESEHTCEEKDLFEKSRNLIIRTTQDYFYAEETQCLRHKKPLSRDSSLLQLSPFLDSDGVLRVGGRLSNADLCEDKSNPIIIPKSSHVASLIIRQCHEKVFHQGRHLTEGVIRSHGYWIIGMKRLVTSYINNCVACKKLRGQFEQVKMANLPSDRVNPGPPFTSVGVDTFGPWEVVARKTRGGLSQSKRWAIMFTCLTTRGVHIELVEDMSSCAFINALRRLTALRGNVKILRSDKGTNFVGASSLLNMNCINVEDGPVLNFLKEQNSTRIFNAPHSSHMGGVWERMIGVTRRILDAMLLDHKGKHLTHDVLNTFMSEVCAVINSRPLTQITTDASEPFILTPNFLVTQKPNCEPVPSVCYTEKDFYLSQWKRVQILADMFWKRWKNEFLQSLQTRRKWQNDMPNVKNGDIVLIKDKELHRNNWLMGRISDAIISDDGKVRKCIVNVFRDGKMTCYSRPVVDLVLLVK